jgi:hypothetical protein
MARPKRQADCHPNKPHLAKGLCQVCYDRQYKQKNKEFNPDCSKQSATCHSDKPVYAKGLCRRCYEIKLREINPGYAERQRNTCKDWQKRNAEYVKLKGQIRNANPVLRERDRSTKWRLRLSRLGLTEETYKQLCEKGCCICGSKKYLHIDHDHNTGKFRGILCSRCNNGLGFFNDSIEGLENALKYLRSLEEKDSV